MSWTDEIWKHDLCSFYVPVICNPLLLKCRGLSCLIVGTFIYSYSIPTCHSYGLAYLRSLYQLLKMIQSNHELSPIVDKLQIGRFRSRRTTEDRLSHFIYANQMVKIYRNLHSQFLLCPIFVCYMYSSGGLIWI